jgi:protein TonB
VRPKVTAKPERKVEKPARAEAQRKADSKPKAAVKAKKPAGGDGGKNASTATKGASGAKTAGKASQAGNAAVSNYPGKVASKLRRSLRYPREARGGKLRGEVLVSFVVGSNGSVSSVRVARSSGSPVLDQAAGDAVRRAAPFPPIPADAGRSNWTFSVPLAFTR